MFGDEIHAAEVKLVSTFEGRFIDSRQMEPKDRLELDTQPRGVNAVAFSVVLGSCGYLALKRMLILLRNVHI